MSQARMDATNSQRLPGLGGGFVDDVCYMRALFAQKLEVVTW